MILSNSKTKLNVIYIVVHDLGRHLGTYGAKVNTPNLDKIAKNNIKFTNAYCNSAVCSPSRGCAMSGKHAHKNGIVGLTHFGWRMNDDCDSIVQIFNKNNYETVHCGLSHEGEEGDLHYQYDHEVSWDSRNVENAVDDAIAFLKARSKNQEKPFYLNVGTQEVHSSIWSRNNKSDRLFTKYGGPVPPDDVYLPPQVPDYPCFKDMFGRFQASVEYMDKEIKYLFDAIDKFGFSDNTMVVFTTDHGVYAPRGKGCLYDFGMANSLIVKMPENMKKQFQYDGLIQNIDLLPTILDAAGIEIPDDIDGTSFYSLLTGENYKPHDKIVTEWNFGGPYEDYYPIRAIRTEKFHFIKHFAETPRYHYLPNELPEKKNYKDYCCTFGPMAWDEKTVGPAIELFDIEKDPNEFVNLANNSDYADIINDFEKQLAQWMKDNNDNFLTEDRPKPTAKPGLGLLFKN